MNRNFQIYGRLLQKSNSGLYFYKFINFLKDFY